MKVMGIKASDLKEVVKECQGEIKHWPPEKILEFSKELVCTNILECNQVAFLLLWENNPRSEGREEAPAGTRVETLQLPAGHRL